MKRNRETATVGNKHKYEYYSTEDENRQSSVRMGASQATPSGQIFGQIKGMWLLHVPWQVQPARQVHRLGLGRLRAIDKVSQLVVGIPEVDDLDLLLHETPAGGDLHLRSVAPSSGHYGLGALRRLAEGMESKCASNNRDIPATQVF
jgi:hypothetical protein